MTTRCRSAPPVGAMSGYLSRLISSKALSLGSRPHPERRPSAFRGIVEHGVKRAEKTRARARDRAGRCSRSSASTTWGPSTGTTWTTSCRSSATCATMRAQVRSWSTSPPKKGKGYLPAERSADRYHGVSELRRRHRRAEGVRSQCTVVHEGLRRRPWSKRRRRGRPDLRNHGRDAVGNRGRPLFEQRLPRAGSFDVGLAEQHAVTFAAGLRRRRDEAVRQQSTRPFSSEPTTRLCTTSRFRACRFGSLWIGRGWWARTGRRMRGRTTSRTSVACPGFVLMAAADESRACAHGPHRS